MYEAKRENKLVLLGTFHRYMQSMWTILGIVAFSWFLNANGHAESKWVVPVWPEDDSQLSPSIAADGAGGVFMVWTIRKTLGHIAIAQRFNSDGAAQWGAKGVIVCTTAAGHQDNPHIVADGIGGAVIVWRESRPNLPSAVYAQRLNSQGIPQWQAEGVMITSESTFYTKIASDAAGGAIVAYVSESLNQSVMGIKRITGSGQVQWGPLNARIVLINGGFTLAGDGLGGAFLIMSSYATIDAHKFTGTGTRQEIRVCTLSDGSLAGANAQIADDGAGGAIIAWHDRRNENADIFAQRINANGSVLWQTNGLPVYVGSLDQEMSSIVADGTGGAIVAWQDNDQPGRGVTAQRINAAGIPQWPGTTLSFTHSINLQMIGDGQGGAVVTWHGTFVGGIWAQKITSWGFPLWNEGGRNISADNDYGDGPSIALDKACGAYFTEYNRMTGLVYLLRTGYSQESPSNAPDIKITKYENTVGVPGKNLNISLVATNHGTAVAQNVILSVKTGGTIAPVLQASVSQGSVAQTSLETQGHFGGLAPGQSAKLGLTVLPSEAGQLILEGAAAVDGFDDTPCDNKFEFNYAVASGPNLMAAPRPAIFGGPTITQVCKTTPFGNYCKIKSSFMISNLGDQDAKKFEYRLYLSADDQLSEDDLLISTKAVKKLAADANRKVKFNYKLELNSSASGKYLLLQTDSEQSVEETNETDNVVATSQVP